MREKNKGRVAVFVVVALFPHHQPIPAPPITTSHTMEHLLRVLLHFQNTKASFHRAPPQARRTHTRARIVCTRIKQGCRRNVKSVIPVPPPTAPSVPG